MDASNAIWNTEGAAKRDAVQQMFGRIASRYDLLNGFMSLRLHHRWRAYATSLLQLQPGQNALDICSGTGDFLAPLRRAVGTTGMVLGLDFCAPMLAVGQKKNVPADELILADACRLPIASTSMHGVTVGWGIRNVPDIDMAHREIARVLKRDGRFVSLDMAIPRNTVVRFGSRVVCGYVLPAVGSLFGMREAYTYLPKSTEKFSSREQLIASMQKAGFKDCGWKDLIFGNVCLHWGTKA
jgi:demethylmenaquinone methyltransferase/2-methoxy-6-polyprenyl-1,4-benzoquinol methylase